MFSIKYDATATATNSIVDGMKESFIIFHFSSFKFFIFNLIPARHKITQNATFLKIKIIRILRITTVSVYSLPNN